MLGELPELESKVPYPPCPALPMPVMAGTSFSSCCADCTPVASMASRPTVITFDPSGGAPRMLVPVTITSSSPSLFAVFLVFSACEPCDDGPASTLAPCACAEECTPQAAHSMLIDKNSSALLNLFLMLPPQNVIYVSQSSLFSRPGGGRSTHRSSYQRGRPEPRPEQALATRQWAIHQWQRDRPMKSRHRAPRPPCRCCVRYAPCPAEWL